MIHAEGSGSAPTLQELRENSANARRLGDTERDGRAQKTAPDLRFLPKSLVWITLGTRFEGGGAHQVPRHLRWRSYLVRRGARRIRGASAAPGSLRASGPSSGWTAPECRCSRRSPWPWGYLAARQAAVRSTRSTSIEPAGSARGNPESSTTKSVKVRRCAPSGNGQSPPEPCVDSPLEMERWLHLRSAPTAAPRRRSTPRDEVAKSAPGSSVGSTPGTSSYSSEIPSASIRFSGSALLRRGGASPPPECCSSAATDLCDLVP